MKQYTVDAFTDTVFQGNQAAICVLDEWLSDTLMLNITRENNFSETAFTVKEHDAYRLRWFTPAGEIDLCGHATLASAFVLFNFYEHDAQSITFHTMSGDLFIGRRANAITMDFPAYTCQEVPVTDSMEQALGMRPQQAFLDRDLLLIYDDENIVRNMKPDFDKLSLLDGLGVAITAPATPESRFDCVSRFFAPKLGIEEDPVTGSVHCMIAPYWAQHLGKNTISAYQASERSGEMICELRGERVVLLGKAALFSVAELNVFNS
ncbi:MAG: PhzF family phenazine biosynthesis protein [Atopobiaceae bacterium]|nr:PhzF family phenazine biosynthesis protein [Atopobiaceae bacterium]